MISQEVYQDIKPYTNDEVAVAFERVTKEPMFIAAMQQLWPEKSVEEITSIGNSIKSTDDVQERIMHPGIRRIMENSSDGLSCSGFENLRPEQGYLFLSNHRDIFLDAGILQILLFEHNIPTSEIAFGSNLMSTQLIIDLGKSNKMFTAYRGGNDRKEIYENTKNFSAYIRKVISEKQHSVWISQRDGRTKDGKDATESRLLKILNMTSADLIDGFKEINIVPVSLSYEYEPCATFKVREMYESKDRPYIKAPDEDFKSIIAGVLEPKGRIHLAIGTPINQKIDGISLVNTNEQIRQLTALIDEEIFSNYKLWPTNYIAADLLNEDNEYPDHYNEEDKIRFEEYLENILDSLDGDSIELKKMLLEIYSNPIQNVIVPQQ